MSDIRGVTVRLERRLGAVTNGPCPLEGGITNRNYRVAFARRECVVRLLGKETALLGISREAERMATAAAAALNIAPELVAADAECLVTAYLAGEPASPREVATMAQPLGVALRTFHESGVELPVRFWVPDLLRAYAGIVKARGGRLPAAFGRACAVVDRIARVLPLTEPVPCHNDLLPSNILLTASGAVVLLDWEYAGMGHRLFDLGNLAVNSELGREEEERLLSAYLERRPDERALAALRLMRVVSDAREAAWGVVQGALSDLEFDFAGYAARHFTRLDGAASSPWFESALELAGAGAHAHG